MDENQKCIVCSNESVSGAITVTSMYSLVDVGDKVLVKRTPNGDHGNRYERSGFGHGDCVSNIDTNEL